MSTTVQKEFRGSAASKSLQTIATGLLVGGLVLCAITYTSDAYRFWHTYLVMFMFLLSLGLGSLFFLALEYLVGANWSTPIRRVMEILAGQLHWIFILSLPLFFFGKVTITTKKKWMHQWRF